MLKLSIDQQIHGYRHGHELLGSTIHLDPLDQDTVDRLSDLSGQARPGELYRPYVTCYPSPSKKYFVVARTWQDLDAPRAGCVLTRSLFVPMDLWGSRVCEPSSILNAIQSVDREDRELNKISLAVIHQQLPPVESGALTELVEATFLESRQALVIFGAEHAEAIATRLLTAFWSDMRRTFSLCTYALAPRLLARDHPFDLLFAPESARSRYSQWQGRKIEDFQRQVVPRHRWSEQLVSAVFRDSKPTLEVPEVLTSSDGHVNESDLRLALLWRELLERTASSPSAVLGLIDILMSRNRTVGEDPKLVATVGSAIVAARTNEPLNEAWAFLKALLGKFTREEIPPELRSNVRDTSRALAARNAAQSLDFLNAAYGLASEIPREFAEGVSSALAADDVAARKAVPLIDHRLAARLLSLSRTLCDALMRQPRDASLTAAITAAVSSADPRSLVRLRRNLIGHIETAEDSPLLAALLQRASMRQMLALAGMLEQRTKFAVPALDRPLLDAALTVDRKWALRGLLLDGVLDTGSVRLLKSSLSLSIESLNWLAQFADDRRINSPALACQMLERYGDTETKQFLFDPANSESIVDLLMLGSWESARQVNRIIPWLNVTRELMVKIGAFIVSHNEPLSIESGNLVLTAALQSKNFETKTTAAAALSGAQTSITPNQLIDLVTPPRAHWNEINANLKLICNGSDQPINLIISSIDRLSDLLASKPDRGMTDETVWYWASLIEQAIRRRIPAAGGAATSALEFAFHNTGLNTSQLVVVTFPVIYNELANGGDSRLFQSSFFGDWDRCKKARKSLAEAFVNSAWPPADIVVVGWTIGALDSILKYVLRLWRGDEYMHRIHNDISRLSNEQQESYFSAIYRLGRESR